MFESSTIYRLVVTIPEGEYDALQAWDVEELHSAGTVEPPGYGETCYRVVFDLGSASEREQLQGKVKAFLESWGLMVLTP